MQQTNYDVIIVGAGIIGPSLSIQFARQNRKVLVVERDLSEPNRIVGELMQPGGMKTLEKLGLAKATEGIDAVDVIGYEIFFGGERVHIPYPKIEQDSKKPGTALVKDEREKGKAFHHGRFVMNLRKLMLAEPNVTVLEETVTEIIHKGQEEKPSSKDTEPSENEASATIVGIRTKTKAGETHAYFAPLTVVADGTTSKFRKEFTSRTPIVKSHFVGLVLKDADMPHPNCGHVVLGSQHAPVLVYQIGTHETRILCDLQGDVPSVSSGAMKEHLLESVLPAVPEQLQGSLKAAILDGQFRVMPNQFLPTSPCRNPGLVLLGDAWNMRHPLTGGGMTVALNDVYQLSQNLASIPDFSDWIQVELEIDDFYWSRKTLASVINILAQSLYALFAAGDSANLRVLQKGCFQYFQRGGNCVDGPISLISGVMPRPLVLLYHFFSVALYAIQCNFSEKGLTGFPVALVQAFTVMWTATVVIMPFVLEELKWY